MKKQREEYVQRQKEAALQRAAELVNSNRIPIEITRGVAAAAVNQLVDSPLQQGDASVMPSAAVTSPEPPPKKSRSSIVISTASDLDQIVTHSNNLWAKYNAIAKEHNQRVNWVVVAKELGIHVKVREKYARMHSRAMARGFDFVNWGHYRIKDYPQYFTDPLGPSIEATLQANVVAAPETAHVSTFNAGVQVSVPPTMNANQMSSHDALGLAAQVAGRMGAGINCDTFSDASSTGAAESVAPLVHGLSSEVQASQFNGYNSNNGYNSLFNGFSLPSNGANNGHNGSFPV